jgi:hypothetical protein
VATTQPNIYIQTFESIVRHLAQQEVARLRPHVTERAEGSVQHNWERLGTSDAVVKSARLTPTPEADTPWTRRISIAATYHNADSTEQEDPSQMLVDPNSNLAMSLGYSMRRATDDILITAATADAQNETGTPIAFDVNQIVGDYTTPISFDFVTAVQEKFMDNDIDPSFPKVAVVGPTQVRKLMQLTEQTSSDYVQTQALQQLSSVGIVPMWMGFTWICSTRLIHPTAPGTDIDCLFFSKRALGLHVAKDISARIAEDPSVSFAWRIYCNLVMGAVRVEDEHIVWGQLADTL